MLSVTHSKTVRKTTEEPKVEREGGKPMKTAMLISPFLAERQLMQYQQLNMVSGRMQSLQIPTSDLFIYFNLERDLTWGAKVHGMDA